MTITWATLYGRLGKFFHAGNTIQTALATTIEDEVEDAVQQLGGSNTIEYEAARQNVLDSLRALQADCASALAGCVVVPCQKLLIQTVKDDNPQPDDSVEYALAECIKQMIGASQSVDASAPAAAVSYGASNVGTGILVASVKRPDGKVNEHILAESVEGTLTDAPLNGLAGVQLLGEMSVAATEYNWPKGSGCQVYLTSHTAASADNLITNGTMEEESAENADLPEGWIVSVGVLGTTVKLTNVEVQTVVMSGTPTTGYYLLHFTDRNSKVQTTVPLAYNAAQFDVQSALQALAGLESISVVTTGSVPNYTHTITFTGVPNPGQLTSTEYTDSGSLAHATTDAGSANVVRGARSLEHDSDGAENTALQVPVTLEAGTQYAVGMLVKCDSAPAAGRYTIDLVDGIGGTVLADEAGTNNSFYFNAADVTTGWQSLADLVSGAAVFRTPDVLPAVVYFRIRATTAVSNTTSCFFDELCLVPMTALYTGGPSVAVFTGATVWDLDDTITVAVTNDRAGAIHEWMNRVFALRESDLLLPSDAAAGETIDDATYIA